jgi:hypothetical protein
MKSGSALSGPLQMVLSPQGHVESARGRKSNYAGAAWLLSLEASSCQPDLRSCPRTKRRTVLVHIQRAVASVERAPSLARLKNDHRVTQRYNDLIAIHRTGRAPNRFRREVANYEGARPVPKIGKRLLDQKKVDPSGVAFRDPQKPTPLSRRRSKFPAYQMPGGRRPPNRPCIAPGYALSPSESLWRGEALKAFPHCPRIAMRRVRTSKVYL